MWELQEFGGVGANSHGWLWSGNGDTETTRHRKSLNIYHHTRNVPQAVGVSINSTRRPTQNLFSLKMFSQTLLFYKT